MIVSILEACFCAGHVRTVASRAAECQGFGERKKRHPTLGTNLSPYRGSCVAGMSSVNTFLAQCLRLIEDDEVVVVEPVVGDLEASGKEAMLDQVGDMEGAGSNGWGLRRSYERRGVGLGV